MSGIPTCARCFVAALLTLGAAACGLAASPAFGLTFRPPAGWKASAGILGFMQFWRSQTDPREILMLFKSPTHLDPDRLFASDGVENTLHDARITARRTITICRGQPALEVSAEGTAVKGGRDRIDAVMSDAGGSSYVAMYVRPLGAAPNAMALAALRELCAKP